MIKKSIFIIVGMVCMFTTCGCCLLGILGPWWGERRVQTEDWRPDPNECRFPKEYEIFGTGTQAEVAAALKKLAAEPLPKKETDRCGFTPLMVAASTNCDPAVIDMIVKAGYAAQAKDSSGYTALFYAAAQNTNPEVTKVLAGYGGINEKDRYGRVTPLYTAVHDNPNPEVARMLIRLHADVTVKDILYLDVLDLDVVTRRREPSKPYCPYDVEGANSYQQQVTLVRELLAAGVKTDKALEQSYKSVEKTKLLLDAGAKVNEFKIKGGCSPLYYVTGTLNNPDVGVLLIKAGADVNAKECSPGWNTPLLKLAREWQNLPGDQSLKLAGVWQRPDDNERAKALLRLAAALIDAGADVNVTNYSGKTAHDLAKASPRLELEELLLKAGAKPGSAFDTKN